MPLRRAREPFDHADWLYELKYDGFRALAFVGRTGVELVSRNAHAFPQLALLAEKRRQLVLRRRIRTIEAPIATFRRRHSPSTLR
jgi:ATP-dependent DNA ligase